MSFRILWAKVELRRRVSLIAVSQQAWPECSWISCGGEEEDFMGGKHLVETCRSIDIRQWQRQRLLEPESRFSWCWQEAGVTVASINVQVKTELVVLTYKARWPGREWQDIDERIGLHHLETRFDKPHVRLAGQSGGDRGADGRSRQRCWPQKLRGR